MLTLFTARGRLLIKVMEQPRITTKELGDSLFLTRRTVWGAIGELRRLGYLAVSKEGRAHRYSISSFGLAELRKLTEGVKHGSQS